MECATRNRRSGEARLEYDALRKLRRMRRDACACRDNLDYLFATARADNFAAEIRAALPQLADQIV